MDICLQGRCKVENTSKRLQARRLRYKCGARLKSKRAASLQPFEFLARPAGIEPTTPWFVARYSIQLSYGRLI